jgi:hypothetical protein
VVNSNRDGCIGNVSGDEAEQVSNGTDYGLSGAASAMGNAPQREDHGREPRDMGLETSQGRCGDHAADGASEGMGNAMQSRPSSEWSSGRQQDGLGQPSDQAMGNASECHGVNASRIRGALERQEGRREHCDTGLEGAAMGNSSSKRCEQDSALRGEQQSSGTSEECGAGVAEKPDGKIERTMGYTIDGTPDGLGHAQLSGLCDTELDEIREWMVKCDNRTDELRLLGNGVLPATAERAFRVLMEELSQEK